MRRLARILLSLITCLSLALGGWGLYQITQNPLLRPVIERSQDEIIAATDRMLAREATPERVTALIEARLTEVPRNWVALEGLKDLAEARAIPLPEGYQTAWDQDSGFWATSGDCAACIWDAANCSIETALLCKAPIAITPIDDLRGIAKAGIDYSTGEEVDQLDLGLSVLGLGATAALIATGGGSGLVKAGAGAFKLARSMGRVSPKLLRMTDDALKASLRGTDALRPLGEVLGSLGKVSQTLGPKQALHLLPLVDDAADASKLVRTTNALGPRSVGVFEVLGKSKVFRATLRYGDEALALLTGLVGALTSIAMLIANAIQSLFLRGLRRSLRD